MGAGNSIVLQVGSALSPNSNDNQFACVRHGDGKALDGSTAGIGNEVAIVQAGNSNYASFSQIGNFNSIGVSQERCWAASVIAFREERNEGGRTSDPGMSVGENRQGGGNGTWKFLQEAPLWCFSFRRWVGD